MSDALIEPLWIPTFEQVCAICARLVAQTGEPYALLDEGLLRGALYRMQSFWEYNPDATVYRIAARLIAAIAQAHAFQQGNKRTSLVAGGVFCRANGFPLNLCDDEDVAMLVEAAVDHHPEAELGLAMVIEDYATNVIQKYRQV